MIAGGCLCGGVRYVYDGTLTELSMCHCRMCRRATGSAYLAVAPVETERLNVTDGRDLLREYRAVPNKARVFCGRCGSPLYSFRDDRPDVRRLRVGTLDEPIAPVEAYHAFVASKANWETLPDDDLPRHAGRKPEAVRKV